LNELSREGREEERRKTLNHNSTNFNEVHLKNGITRVVNGLEGKNFFSPSQPSRSSRDTQLSAT